MHFTEIKRVTGSSGIQRLTLSGVGGPCHRGARGASDKSYGRKSGTDSRVSLLDEATLIRPILNGSRCNQACSELYATLRSTRSNPIFWSWPDTIAGLSREAITPRRTTARLTRGNGIAGT